MPDLEGGGAGGAGGRVVMHFYFPSFFPTDVACESYSIVVLSVKRPSLGPLDQSVTFKYTAIS